MEITVYTLSIEGYGSMTTDNPADVLEMISEHLKEGAGVLPATVFVSTTTREEYDALPEFTGF